MGRHSPIRSVARFLGFVLFLIVVGILLGVIYHAFQIH